MKAYLEIPAEQVEQKVREVVREVASALLPDGTNIGKISILDVDGEEVSENLLADITHFKVELKIGQ